MQTIQLLLLVASRKLLRNDFIELKISDLARFLRKCPAGQKLFPFSSQCRQAISKIN